MSPTFLTLGYSNVLSKPFHWLRIVLTFIRLASYFCCVGSAYNEQRFDYSGAQVLKVSYCPELIEIVYKNDLNIWSGNATHIDIMVPANKVNLIKTELSRYLILYCVMIPDIDVIIRKQNITTKIISGSSEKRKHYILEYPMNWYNFQRLEVIHDYLEYLAHNFPETVKVGVMGHSVQKRPLKYVKILSENKNASTMFVDGGVHAREWISPASVTYILRELVEKRIQQPDDIKNLELYILPVVNPDGYEYSFTDDRLWRKNRSGSGTCIGTDINRNFDFHWGKKGTSANPCSEIYRGTAPASELETQAVTNFLLKLKGKLRAYVSYHSYGQLILMPYGHDYDSLVPDYEELKSVGDLAAEKIFKIGGLKYAVGNTAHLLYPASGGSDDWARAVIGVKYSYTVELRDTGKYSFLLPPEEIVPAAIDAFIAFKEIASAASKL